LGIALAACVIVAAGCGGGAGDVLSALGRASGSEVRVSSDLAGFGSGLSTGTVPAAASLQHEASVIDQASSQVADVANSGNLTADQSSQATADSATIAGTKHDIATEQTIATDATTAAPSSANERSISEKLVKRARSRICETIHREQNSEPEPTPSDAEEETEVSSEVESELGSETQAVAHIIVGDVRSLVTTVEQNLHNVISLNPAGRAEILQAAASHFGC
jgi:hypothetical protein